MAETDIKNWVNDLRISEENVGAFLTVDENCNVKWTQTPNQTAGEVWQYVQIEKDSIVQLPQADISEGLCIALLRCPYKLEEDGTKQTGYAKVIILPHHYGNPEETTIEPNYKCDMFQGGQNFYTSAGVSVSSNGINSEGENDPFASIILKSVATGSTCQWVIINGVGSWNGEEIDLKKVGGTKNIIDTDSDGWVKVTPYTQTAGANTLSASIGSTDTVFKAFSKGNADTFKAVKNSNFSNLNPTLNNPCLSFSFHGGTYSKEYLPPARVDYNVGNALTTTVYNFFKDDTKLLNLNAYGRNFGRIYGSSIPSSMKTEQDYCITKKLGNLHFFDTNSDFGDNFLGAQWKFRVNLNNFESIDGQVKNIRKLFTSIFISQEDARNTCILYKANKNLGNLSAMGLDEVYNNVVELFRYENPEDNVSQGNGNLVAIPIAENEVEFDIVLEVFRNTTTTNTTITSSATDSSLKWVNCPDELVISFWGAETLKQVSLSPDIEFECLAGDNWAGWTYSLDSNGAISNGYLDSSFNSLLFDSNTENKKYFGPTFFSNNGAYLPGSDITKTVIRYHGDYLEGQDVSTENHLADCTLVIDWAKQTWNFSGNLMWGPSSLSTSYQNQPFYNTNGSSLHNIIFKQTGRPIDANVIELKESLQISSQGLSRLPFISSTLTSPVFNIENYKTIVNPEGKAIEMLCNYRCGWQRASEIWTNTVSVDSSGKFDNSEFDGLVGDYNTANATTLSPSKACIEPAHKRRNPEKVAIPSVSDYPGLLPYYGYKSSTSNSDLSQYGYYWSVDPKYFNMNYAYDHNCPVVANSFCNLNFQPETTGQLICNITIPFLNVIAGGYMIVKRIQNTNGSFENFRIIKDSGTPTNISYNTKNQLAHINFTDKVISGQKIKYTLLIYSTIYAHYPHKDIGGAHNIIVSQMMTDAWFSIFDFKSYFDKDYYTTWKPTNKNWDTLNKIFFNINFGNDQVDAFPLDNLAVALFGNNADGDTSVMNNIETPSTNPGSAFEFLAYIIRD